MQRNRSRADLKSDILSTLGHPIVKVNLTDNHLDNCINAAIKKFWRWHHDGSYQNQYVYTPTEEDVARGWFVVPEYIDAVLEVISTNDIMSSTNFATMAWQMTASTILAANRFSPMSLTDYVSVQQQVLNTRAIVGDGVKPFEFARLQHRVIPRFKMTVDKPIVLMVYENVDAERTDPAAIDASLMFDNETLKDLSCAYAKQQWGQILKRFSGMQLPGGVVIDGETLIQEGKQDEAEVMQRLKDETVVNFFMG